MTAITQQTKNTSGMTLIESMIALLILTIVGIGALSIMPAVRNQQKNEDTKAVARKVLLDAAGYYRQLQYAPFFLKQTGSEIMWVSCFDVNGNPTGIAGTQTVDPKAYVGSDASFRNNPVPGACSSAAKTVELHAWLESNNRVKTIRFLALARLPNNAVIPIQGDSYVTSN